MSTERMGKHKVRVVHEHTGTAKGGECFKWDGRIGLFLDTYSVGKRHVHRSAVGDRRGSTWRWTPIGCNTPDCEFEALVRVDWLEDLISDVIEGREPGQ